MEDAMLEFSDIFASELTTAVYVAGSLAMIFILVTIALWMNRKPAATSARGLAAWH